LIVYAGGFCCYASWIFLCLYYVHLPPCALATMCTLPPCALCHHVHFATMYTLPPCALCHHVHFATMCTSTFFTGPGLELNQLRPLSTKSIMPFEFVPTKPNLKVPDLTCFHHTLSNVCFASSHLSMKTTAIDHYF